MTVTKKDLISHISYSMFSVSWLMFSMHFLSVHDIEKEQSTLSRPDFWGFISIYLIVTALWFWKKVGWSHEHHHANSKKFQHILEKLPLGIAINEISSNKAVFVNPQFSSIYGWSLEDISDVGSFFEKVYPDAEYRKQIQTQIMEDISTGDPSRMIWKNIEITTSEGEKRRVNGQNFPLVEHDLMVSTVFDVTDVWKRNAEINFEYQRTQTLVSNLPVAVLEWDDQFRILNWSGNAEQIFGIHREEALGHSLFEVLSMNPIAQGEIEESLKSFRNKEDLNKARKIQLSCKNGLIIKTNWINAAFYDQNQSVTRVLSIVEDITESEQIKERNEQAAFYLNTMTDPVVVVDRHYKILEVNKAFNQLWQAEEKQLIGSELLLLFPVMEKTHLLEQFSTCVEKTKKVIFHTKMVQSDGTRVPLEISAQALFSGDERKGYTMIISDMRDRQFYQHDLKFKSFLLDRIGEAVVASDAKGKLTYLNNHASELYKVHPREVIGKPLSDLYHSMEASPHSKFIRREDNSQSWVAEFLVKRKDGSQFHAAISKTPFYDRKGQIEGVVGVTRDISLDIERITRLNLERERLDMAQQVAKIGSWTLNIKNKHLEFSDETFRIFGVKKRNFDLTLESVFQFIRKEEKKDIIIQFNDSLNHEGIHSLVHRITSHDGEQKDILQTWKITHDKKGNAIEAFGTIQDITKIKNVERALKKLSDQLSELYIKHEKEIEEERIRISRDLHDELGQFLTVIKMDLHRLKNKLSDEYKVQPIVNLLLERIDEAFVLVRKISKKLRPMMLDNLSLLEAIKWHLREIEESSGIQSEFSTNVEDLNLSIEQSLNLFRIIQEATTNVIKHANASNLKVSILIKNSHLDITIEDDGIGIRQTKNAGENGGLGLVGIQERAKLLGADLTISSKKDQGTKIKISFEYLNLSKALMS